MDKTEKLRLESLLMLIHEENKLLMSTALIHTCYPKDYERVEKQVLGEWDKAFERIMQIGETEQHRRDDNSRTDHSG